MCEGEITYSEPIYKRERERETTVRGTTRNNIL